MLSVSSASDTSSSSSVNGESFYLHNPQEVIYNRVKDLFDTQSSRQSSHNQQSMSALTGEFITILIRKFFY